MIRPWISIAALLLAGAAAAGERPARMPPCPGNLPEGVRLPPQPGCPADAPVAAPRRPPGPDDGTSVRIGGRVGTEFGARR